MPQGDLTGTGGRLEKEERGAAAHQPRPFLDATGFRGAVAMQIRYHNPPFEGRAETLSGRERVSASSPPRGVGGKGERSHAESVPAVSFYTPGNIFCGVAP